MNNIEVSTIFNIFKYINKCFGVKGGVFSRLSLLSASPRDVEEPPTRRVCQQPKFIRSPARPRGHRGTAREPPVFVVLMHKYSGTELIRKKLFGIC